MPPSTSRLVIIHCEMFAVRKRLVCVFALDYGWGVFMTRPIASWTIASTQSGLRQDNHATYNPLHPTGLTQPHVTWSIGVSVAINFGIGSTSNLSSTTHHEERLYSVLLSFVKAKNYFNFVPASLITVPSLMRNRIIITRPSGRRSSQLAHRSQGRPRSGCSSLDLCPRGRRMQ